jgi:transcriptional regulator with XRE-family HTH domain
LSNAPDSLKHDLAFDRLLHFFFALGLYHEIRTYDDLARAVGVSRRTITGWFSGSHRPLSPEIVIRLARALGLMKLEADLLLYAISPAWVRYATPPDVLEAFTMLQYREYKIASPIATSATPPTIAEIEQSWTVTFAETFQSNQHNWGLGYKDDGVSRIERAMQDGQFVLTAYNRFHNTIFMGGDSSCFAPPIYYLSVRAQIVCGEAHDDGYALLFEEIGDNCMAIFRIRDQSRMAAVFQTFDSSSFNIYLSRTPTPAIIPGGVNKLAILAINEDHWFYVNDQLTGQCRISRFSRSRLDLGVVAGGGQTVVCHFRDFYVRVPSAAQRYPILDELASSPVT